MSRNVLRLWPILVLVALVSDAQIPSPPIDLEFSGSTFSGTTITVEGTSEGGEIVTLGVPFAEGALIPGDDALVVFTGEGEPLPTQTNPMAHWRTDGSVMHVVVSFEIPAQQGVTDYQIEVAR